MIFAAVNPNTVQNALDLVPAILLAVGVLVVCLRVFGRVVKRVRAGLGAVHPEPLGLPDLMVVIVLATWLGGMSMLGFFKQGPPRLLTMQDMLQSATLFGVLVGGIFVFLKCRHISLYELFGLGRVGPLKVLKCAGIYLAAAYPLVLLCNLAMHLALGEKAQTQEIMQYFVDAIKRSDRASVLVTVLLGVVVAPVAEELLFRGYLYGTLRRHVGPWVGMIAGAALFALIHVNLPALPALFVLALCLTLAYEATGSLLVCMAMHATFNGITLGLVFLNARGTP